MGKRFIKALKLIVNEILDVVYPPEEICISCRSDGYVGLCNICESKIRRVRSNQNILSFAYYGGPIKRIILSLKYKNNFFAGKLLGNYLCKLINENNIVADCIFYVPISKETLKIRGFNQCEIMAKVISEQFEIPIYHSLIKVKNTKEQKTLSKDERKKNLIGVFDVNKPKEVYGKSIILLDDVTTTGATLIECEKILKKYGASTIKLLTVAQSTI